MMPTIPPFVRKTGLNVDAEEVRRVLAVAPRSRVAYQGLAERLATDAEFYSLRANDPLLSLRDRARCQGLADALWREYEGAKTTAEALAVYGNLLAGEAAIIAGECAALGQR
jgi:hypothetical protein